MNQSFHAIVPSQTYENCSLCIKSQLFIEAQVSGSILQHEQEIMRGTAMRQSQKTR